MSDYRGYRIVSSVDFYGLAIRPGTDYFNRPDRSEFVVSDANGDKIEDGFDSVQEAESFIDNMISGALVRKSRGPENRT
jgi:hypothetical protein